MTFCQHNLIASHASPNPLKRKPIKRIKKGSIFQIGKPWKTSAIIQKCNKCFNHELPSYCRFPASKHDVALGLACFRPCSLDSAGRFCQEPAESKRTANKLQPSSHTAKTVGVLFSCLTNESIYKEIQRSTKKYKEECFGTFVYLVAYTAFCFVS